MRKDYSLIQVAHHLHKYGYIGMKCADFDQLKKKLEEYYNIKAEIRPHPILEASGQTFIVNPSIYVEKNKLSL